MKLICANFKMNLLKDDIHNYLNTIKGKINNKNVIFFPSIPFIEEFAKNNYLVGSQNISFKDFGSITGDTSVLQLKELGITYTIIGHSERRTFFNDSNYIAKKIKLGLDNDLKIVLCIGENLEEFEKEKTLEVLKRELDEALQDNLDIINENNLIIAYEPIWAIGTNKIPTNSCLDNTISKIKGYLKTKYNLNLKVLYGGSVNLDNIEELETIKVIDGYLVGGASLDALKFLSLINKVN